MESAVISTRADLDLIIGTPAHAAFMTMLAGSLYRLEKDDVAGVWRAVEDSSTIQSFGFVRTDFNVVAPVLPVYVPPASTVPQTVTMRQARLALLSAGLLPFVNNAIAGMTGAAGDAARIEWEFSGTVERRRPLALSMAASLGMTEGQLDDLFTKAAAL